MAIGGLYEVHFAEGPALQQIEHVGIHLRADRLHAV